MSRTSVSPGVQRDRRHGRHREMVMRRDKGLCHLCGDPHADAIDHIVPVSWGGSDDPANLAPAHTSCNSSKRDARPDAWTWNRPSMWLDGYGPNAGMGGHSRGELGFRGAVTALAHDSRFSALNVIGVLFAMLIVGFTMFSGDFWTAGPSEGDFVAFGFALLIAFPFLLKFIQFVQEGYEEEA